MSSHSPPVMNPEASPPALEPAPLHETDSQGSRGKRGGRGGHSRASGDAGRGSGGDGPWSCTGCTFINEAPGATTCSMCNTPRSGGNGKGGKGGGRSSKGGKGGGGNGKGGRRAGGSSDGDGIHAHWACAVCTYSNQSSADMCAMCGVGQRHAGLSSQQPHAAALPAGGGGGGGPAGAEVRGRWIKTDCGYEWSVSEGGSHGATRAARRGQRDASHLLNFQPLSGRAELFSTEAPPRRARIAPSVPATARSRVEERTRYRASKLQLLVPAGGDYRIHRASPDVPVDWDVVRAVRARAWRRRRRYAARLASHASAHHGAHSPPQVRLASSEAIRCPICLAEPPVAPHLHGCGHVLCLVCALRYHSACDVSGKACTCPLCLAPVLQGMTTDDH